MHPLIRSALRSTTLLLLPAALACGAIGCVTVHYTVNETPRTDSAPALAASGTGAPVSDDPRIVYVPIDRSTVDRTYVYYDRGGSVVVVPSETRYERPVVDHGGTTTPPPATTRSADRTGGTVVEAPPATDVPAVPRTSRPTPPIVRAPSGSMAGTLPPISEGDAVSRPAHDPPVVTAPATRGSGTLPPIAEGDAVSRPAQHPPVVTAPARRTGETLPPISESDRAVHRAPAPPATHTAERNTGTLPPVSAGAADARVRPTPLDGDVGVTTVRNAPAAEVRLREVRQEKPAADAPSAGVVRGGAVSSAAASGGNVREVRDEKGGAVSDDSVQEMQSAASVGATISVPAASVGAASGGAVVRQP